MVLMKKKWGGKRGKRFYSESQNCRNTLPLSSFDQLVKSAKNEMLFYISEPGEQIQIGWTVKAWVYLRWLLPKIVGSSSQF